MIKHSSLSEVICAMLVAATAMVAEAGQPHDGVRDALVCGLAAWERSIGCIETEEEMWQPTGSEGTWKMSAASVRGFAGPAHWYMRTTSMLGKSGGAITGLYIASGSSMLTVGDEPAGPGMVKEPDLLFSIAVRSQSSMLGRWCDPASFRSLEELLQDGEVTRLDPEPPRNLPGLRWRGRLAPDASDVALDVRLDPSRGFAVISWTMHDPATGVIAEHQENLRFELIDGVYIPTLGVATAFSVRPTGARWEETRARMLEGAKVLSRIGVPPGIEGAERVGVQNELDKCVQRLRAEPRVGQEAVCFPKIGEKGPVLNPMVVRTKVLSLNRGFSRLPELARPFATRMVRDFNRDRERRFSELLTEMTFPEARTPANVPPTRAPLSKPDAPSNATHDKKEIP